MKFRLFKKKEFTDETIYEVLGTQVYIRNGHGFGFISDHELYDNEYLEIGFGRTTSGYGDWGGGFDRATTCPLKIIVDRDLNVIKGKTDSFYNSDHSKEVEKEAEKLLEKLPPVFVITNENLKNTLKRAFRTLPVKKCMGLDFDVLEEEHMLEYLREEKAKDIKYEREKAQWEKEEAEWETETKQKK